MSRMVPIIDQQLNREYDFDHQKLLKETVHQMELYFFSQGSRNHLTNNRSNDNVESSFIALHLATLIDFAHLFTASYTDYFAFNSYFTGR